MTVYDRPPDRFSDNPLPPEESRDYWAPDVGVDGGAASAAEAAVPIV